MTIGVNGGKQMTVMNMTEAKAREIWAAEDPNDYEREELRAVDRWIKDHALRQLDMHLHKISTTAALKDFVTAMASFHYGSVEVDELLQALRCYPNWIKIREDL
jgi:hypothetical protein